MEPLSGTISLSKSIVTGPEGIGVVEVDKVAGVVVVGVVVVAVVVTVGAAEVLGEVSVGVAEVDAGLVVTDVVWVVATEVFAGDLAEPSPLLAATITIAIIATTANPQAASAHTGKRDGPSS